MRDPTPLRNPVPARRRPGRRREDPVGGHPRNTGKRPVRAKDFNDPGFHVDLAVRVTPIRQDWALAALGNRQSSGRSGDAGTDRHSRAG